MSAVDGKLFRVICGQTCQRLPFHPLIHATIHPLNHLHLTCYSFIHSLIHSFTHSFTHSFIHPFIHSLIHSFIHPFIHSLIHSFIHPFIHSLIHSFTHSFTSSFVHPQVKDLKRIVITNKAFIYIDLLDKSETFVAITDANLFTITMMFAAAIYSNDAACTSVKIGCAFMHVISQGAAPLSHRNFLNHWLNSTLSQMSCTCMHGQKEGCPTKKIEQMDKWHGFLRHAQFVEGR